MSAPSVLQDVTVAQRVAATSAHLAPKELTTFNHHLIRTHVPQAALMDMKQMTRYLLVSNAHPRRLGIIQNV